jgi:hypothetical protein
MPEKPKKKKETLEKEPETGDRSSWAEDQKEKDYYYDDSHGYEVFDPAELKDDDEDD